jgi:hypothetical protein
MQITPPQGSREYSISYTINSYSGTVQSSIYDGWHFNGNGYITHSESGVISDTAIPAGTYQVQLTDIMNISEWDTRDGHTDTVSDYHFSKIIYTVNFKNSRDEVSTYVGSTFLGSWWSADSSEAPFFSNYMDPPFEGME